MVGRAGQLSRGLWSPTCLGDPAGGWEQNLGTPQGGFFLLGGKEPPLKSERNDSLSTPLVSCGSLWWVSLWREGPGTETEETTMGRLPAPRSGLCDSLHHSPPCLTRPPSLFSFLRQMPTAHCMYITQLLSQHICIYTSVYIYRVVPSPFLFLRTYGNNTVTDERKCIIVKFIFFNNVVYNGGRKGGGLPVFLPQSG